jgi:ATP-binding cassette, subfamily B, multidrug efflux pump
MNAKTINAKTMKATERIQMPGGPGRGMGNATIAQKPISFVASGKRVLARLRPQRLRIFAVIAAGVLSVGLSASGPRVLGHATDLIFSGVIGKSLPDGISKAQAIENATATGQGRFADLLRSMDVVPGQGIDFAAVAHVLMVVLALYAAAALLSFLQGFILNGVVQATVRQLREDVESKLNRLPLRYFDRQPRGELLSRITNDIDNVSQSLQQTLSQLLTALLTILFVLGMMFYISPTLALIALVTIPVTMMVAGFVMRRSQKEFVGQWRSTGALNARIEEAFTGHALMKVFGRHKEVQAAFETDNERLYQSAFRAQFLSGLIMPIAMFVGNLNYVLVAVLGGLRVAHGAMSLGEVQAFIQYSRQFTQPVNQAASMVNLLQSGVASAERVFELLDAEEQRPDAPDAKIPAAAQGRVTFDKASFRYVPERALIEELSMTVEPGQTVAIVGPTGAGKTTLVNLIMRFYELDSGRIELDGVDIATMSRSALRSQIGMVLQDTWLFKGTIRDNIAYGRPGASEAEIMAAAKATFVDRFVQTLPGGYDTVIDDEASNISTGEKQLITIARAFIAQPALLILDEATSSVDTRTEVLLQHAMTALRSNRTSFVIAHRLSTIRDADLILVMQEGRIVERGTHGELVERSGVYADLYRSQFSGPET